MMLKGLVSYADLVIPGILVVTGRTNVAFVIDDATLAFQSSLWSSECAEKEMPVILKSVSRGKSSLGW